MSLELIRHLAVAYAATLTPAFVAVQVIVLGLVVLLSTRAVTRRGAERLLNR